MCDLLHGYGGLEKRLQPDGETEILETEMPQCSEGCCIALYNDLPLGRPESGPKQQGGICEPKCANGPGDPGCNTKNTLQQSLVFCGTRSLSSVATEQEDLVERTWQLNQCDRTPESTNIKYCI